jgi:hypothetical protein
MSDYCKSLLDIAAAVKALQESPNPTKEQYDAVLSEIMTVLLKQHEEKTRKPPAKRAKIEETVGTSTIPKTQLQRIHPKPLKHIVENLLKTNYIEKEEHDQILKEYTTGDVNLNAQHLPKVEGPKLIRKEFKKMGFCQAIISRMVSYREHLLANKNQPAIFTTPTPMPGTQPHL